MTIWRILPPNFKSFDWSFWPLYLLVLDLSWLFTDPTRMEGHVAPYHDTFHATFRTTWTCEVTGCYTHMKNGHPGVLNRRREKQHKKKKTVKKRQQERWTSTFKRDLPGDFKVEHYFLSSQIRTWVGIGWIPNLNSHSVGSHWQTIVEWDVQSNPSY